MDQIALESFLQDLDLPAMRYFQTIGSTNDEAWHWVNDSAPNAALVVADEQTAGRGRADRHWVTAPSSSLAFSIVLRSPPVEAQLVSRLVGLSALAVCKALESGLHLQPQIKWPNDVLLKERKVAGILVETRWEGEQLVAAVVGIGINIAPGSINPRVLPPPQLNFPATCVEDVVGQPVDRWELLHAILGSFFDHLPGLALSTLIDEWQERLAFRGELVSLSMAHPDQSPLTTPSPQTGKLVGITRDGSLQLLAASGELVTVQAGELQLRPASRPDEMEDNRYV